MSTIIILEQRVNHVLAKEEKLIKEYLERQQYLGLQTEIIITPIKKIIRGHYDKEIREATFVSGSVGFVEHALKRIGKHPLQPNTYPDCLRDYYHRRLSVSRKYRLNEIKLPVFIKPYNTAKKFTGFVVKDLEDYRLNWVNKNDDLYFSEVVNFVSESRFYAYHPRSIEVAHYAGNPDVCFANQEVIDIIEKCCNTLGYPQVIDIGITEEGKVCVVEVNEPYSFGLYHPVKIDHYIAMIKSHWSKMTK